MGCSSEYPIASMSDPELNKNKWDEVLSGTYSNPFFFLENIENNISLYLLLRR